MGLAEKGKVEGKEVERKGSRGVALRKEKAMEAFVGVGARVLFYPTLLYNVVRCRMQAEFHWWDEVDQHILLGAVPFRKHVLRLLQLGVQGVITLSEPFETLVPSSMYQSRGIDHLVLPTRDYMFAPSLADIGQAVEFIQKNVMSGKTTYIHCKAGRGRSATIVLCYLVKYKNMTPEAAFEFVRSKRPRVLLTHSQSKVVQEFWKQSMNPSTSRGSFGVPSTGDASTVTELDLVGSPADRNTQPRARISLLPCLCASLRTSEHPSHVSHPLPRVKSC